MQFFDNKLIAKFISRHLNLLSVKNFIESILNFKEEWDLPEKEESIILWFYALMISSKFQYSSKDGSDTGNGKSMRAKWKSSAMFIYFLNDYADVTSWQVHIYVW